MPRRPAAITQADVARVMRAAAQSWPDGRFRVRVSGADIIAERVEPAGQGEPAPAQKERLAPAPEWRL